MEITPIAHIRNAYTAKFGVPRQSGLVNAVVSQVVMEKEYRDPEAFRGLEEFSHLWLIWDFSLAHRTSWSPTVRPPRLGGNRRMGVFATRSPFRPNHLGLSCVRLDAVLWKDPEGPVLQVSGADLMNGTPIYDIKPYLPYADCIPDAAGGFTDQAERRLLRVECGEEARSGMTESQWAALRDTLAQDPRPSYQHDPKRIYGMAFGGMNVRFRVSGDILTVLEICPDPSCASDKNKEKI